MYVPPFEKIYLSREMTRAMAVDHPIGDPFGGPAYGERREPVSAIIAIAGMAATAEAAFAGSIMAGLAFAGSALSLVGNVTGNSTLSKIGAVAGIIGGAGAMGLFGEGAQAATWGSTFGAEAAGAGAAPGAALNQTPTATGPSGVDVSSVPASQLDVQGLNPTSSLTSEGLINSATNSSLAGTPTSYDSFGTPAAPGSPAAMNADYGFNAAQQGPSAALQASPAGTTVAAPGAPNAPTAPSVGDPLRAALNSNAGYGAGMTGGETAAFDTATQAAGGAKAAAPGFLDQIKAGQYFDAAKTAGGNIMDLAKSNPGAAYMLGQAASGIGDVLSGKTSAQIDALEAQGQLSKAQADQIRYQIELAKQRKQQLNQNQSVPLGFSVNPNGVQFTGPGLISGARTGG